jgi:hypothetical protein
MQEASLHLTGPSRAIVAIDPVDFEIELKVKGSSTKSSQDRVLMRQTFIYSGGSESTLLSNTNCKIMLQCAKLENTVQATVVSVRVINWRKRAWPFRHGGKVSCVAKGSVKPQVGGKKVVLQHQLTMANSFQGYLHLSRHAVSVELNGELGVIISSPKHSGHIFFPAQECKSSRGICHLGPYEVEVTVAWSLLIQDKRCFISREECVDDGQPFEHTAKVIQRRKITSVTQSATKIYSLLDLISKSVMKLKTEPKLRISDFSISEVQMHMNYIYFDVSSLLQMMEKVHKGYSATDRQAPRTYYKYGLNAIFNGLHQLCTQLDQMGLLSYKGESQSFSELFRDNITKIKLDELEPPVISMENVEAAKGKDQVSPSISSSTNIKFEIEEAKEMGGEEEDCDVPQTEQEYFEYYRQGWVYNWSIFCGTFTQTSE